ncbi:hypothetical protein NE237_001110 [Protea cynaroides]|uniref:Uncharacterized protein n=1 Tax=Protea cynaroides TaxID=273540 RepID=A0A9Q0QY43_9MAGN|nr:hypothetical protein NE237_001110 [Protea cynaroides]
MILLVSYEHCGGEKIFVPRWEVIKDDTAVGDIGVAEEIARGMRHPRDIEYMSKLDEECLITSFLEVTVSNAENETARVRESIPLKITKALEEYKGSVTLTESVMREAASYYCWGAEAVHDWIRARDAD